jgi:hypothetical protein
METNPVYDECPDCGAPVERCGCNDISVMPQFYCVAIYMTDREYGGPEEGGWWYNSYEPIARYGYLTRCFQTYEEARVYENELRSFIEKEKLNEGRRHPNSVLSDGHFTTYITEGHYPEDLPRERPHYE